LADAFHSSLIFCSITPTMSSVFLSMYFILLVEVQLLMMAIIFSVALS
jgi:hypothetical protein